MGFLTFPIIIASPLFLSPLHLLLSSSSSQMNPKVLLSLKQPFAVFFFILSLVEKRLAFASTPGFEDCEPRHCGGILIRYPFWLSGQQPSYCGLPSFNLTCIDHSHTTQTPVLEVLHFSYYVKNIFYDNQSFQVTAASIVDDPCPLPRFNHTSSLYPFSDSSSNKIIFFLYNCSSSNNLSVYQNISCARDGKPAYFGGEYYGPGQLNSASGTCELVLRPVVGQSAVGINGNYAGLLRTGWLVNWTAPDCTECTKSGGRCGYNDSTANIMCICREKTCGGHRSNQRSTIIGIVAGLAGLLVCLCIFLLIYLLHRKMSDEKNVEALLSLYGPVSSKSYKYSEIKRMTKSFSNKLGQGGCGTVYKGTLQDGHAVAVKVLSESRGNGEEFINEVASISRTSHVNIVSLLGFCLEGSKRALVYEFMSNGSLEKFTYSEETEAAGAQLGWEKLYEIAVGIARGLEYLHRGCNTRIVHFDIKPHNILLDQDFHPKISDFGMAKLCSPKESIFSMVSPRGTIGYIAPEVFFRNFGAVSSKSDVYSYGMMVLEMVGVRKNSINAAAENDSEIYFPHWIYDRLDKSDDLGFSGLSMENEEIAKKMIIIGLWCIQMMPVDRPSMSMVVGMLEGNTKDLQMPPKP